MIFPNVWEHKKCSKPTTSVDLPIRNGGFPLEIVDLPLKNCDVPLEMVDFALKM